MPRQRLRGYSAQPDTATSPLQGLHDRKHPHLCRAASAERRRWQGFVEDLALSQVLDTPLGALSLGQGQKLLLSIGFALDVALLLLDEAFNGLDAPSAAWLIEALGEPERRATQIVILSSHAEPALAIDSELRLERIARSGTSAAQLLAV